MPYMPTTKFAAIAAADEIADEAIFYANSPFAEACMTQAARELDPGYGAERTLEDEAFDIHIEVEFDGAEPMAMAQELMRRTGCDSFRAINAIHSAAELHAELDAEDARRAQANAIRQQELARAFSELEGYVFEWAERRFGYTFDEDEAIAADAYEAWTQAWELVDGIPDAIDAAWQRAEAHPRHAANAHECAELAREAEAMQAREESA